MRSLTYLLRRPQDIRQADSHKSYRPVTTLSYRLNHWLHGLDASGYHLANALIYCAAVLAAYRLCCQWMCPSYWSSSAASDRKGLVRARAAALLFCFHPVHVSGGRTEPAVPVVAPRYHLRCHSFLRVYHRWKQWLA